MSVQWGKVEVRIGSGRVPLPQHDTHISKWVLQARREERAERVLGIAGGLLLLGFIGLCTTMTVSLW
jgi:hypothetical protein